MTLTELLAQNDNFTVAYLQDAYEDVVKKLRLFPAVFPAVITGACTVGGFDNPAYLLSPNATETDNSEVCFKQIHTIEDVTYLDELNDEYTIANMVIGDQSGDGYGFTDFSDYNDEFETVPQVYWSGQEIVCTNLDECFVWITGYVYPYFVTATDTSPYAAQHVYEISDMVTTYSAPNLTVDPVLVYPVSAKALALYCHDIGDIFSAGSYENIVTQYINMFNMNPETAGPHAEQQTYQITGSSINDD